LHLLALVLVLLLVLALPEAPGVLFLDLVQGPQHRAPQTLAVRAGAIAEAGRLNGDAGHARYAGGEPRGVVLLVQQLGQRDPQRADLRLERDVGRRVLQRTAQALADQRVVVASVQPGAEERRGIRLFPLAGIRWVLCKCKFRLWRPF
jgi:hypothetical protein